MAPSRAALRFFRLSVIRPQSRHFCILRTTPVQGQASQQKRLPRSFLCAQRRWTATCMRWYSQSAGSEPQPPEHLNEAALHVFNKVKKELEPVSLDVKDISGGCGSMYAIEIESRKFAGLSVIKQHKLVNEVLKEEIKSWHGVQLRTKVAS